MKYSMFSRLLTSIRTAILKPIALKILDDEIKERVKFEVNRELQSQIEALDPPKKIKIVKRKNNSGDLGLMIEFFTKRLYIDKIYFKIEGKSELDTFLNYSKKVDSLKDLHYLLQPSHMDYLRDKLRKKGIKYYKFFKD